jgi:hypothetical protein
MHALDIYQRKLREVCRHSSRSKPQQRRFREKNLAALYFHRDALLHTQSSSVRQLGGNVCAWRACRCGDGRVGHRMRGRMQMTRVTKRAAKVRNIPRRNAAGALQDVRYANQGPSNVILFLFPPERFESSPDSGST